MIFEKIKEKMQQRGYEFTSFKGESFDFHKQVVDGLFINAIVENVVLGTKVLPMIKLYFYWGHLTVSTDQIAFDHSLFGTFESDIKRATLILNGKRNED